MTKRFLVCSAIAAVLTFPTVLSAADEPFAVTNTVDVTAGGVLAEPVQLHRPVFAEWLANPDYNSWTNYTDAGRHYNFPQVTKLVWDTSENAIHMQNLVPGATYEWSATNAAGEVKSGSFTTVADPPRWLTAYVRKDRNIENFRDLGGWEIPGGNGRRTNFGVFFRSASFDAYFESGDLRDLNPMHAEFGINTELDLRGGENIVTIPGDPADGIEGERYYYERPHDKVEEVIGLGPGNSFNTSPSVKDGSVRYFRVEMIVDITRAGSSAGEEIRRAFHVLGTKANHPVDFHCAAGRDRTGYIAFLLEGLCGLREEQLYRDHLAIVFAAQGVMYSERLDGNIRDLYTAREHDGSFSFAKYGDSLAGHIRAYLESLGVTAEELAGVTTAYTGETPDEVLARVDAYEESEGYRTVWFLSRETGTTNAVHRVGRNDLLHPPVFAEERHYRLYRLDRPGYRFAGWSGEKPVPGTSDVCYEAQWESVNPGPAPGVSAWVYDEPSETVSDGGWMLHVSASDGGLTILDVYDAPAEPGVLDLTMPIVTVGGAASGLVFARIGSPGADRCFFCTAPRFKDQISGVRFPSTLTEIGPFAFGGCANLSGTLELPEGLVSVPTNGFSETGIARVVLPESCTRVCRSAFYRCKALTNVVVGTKLKVFENGAFNEDGRLVSYTPAFPSSLEHIGEYACFDNKLTDGDLRLPYVDELTYKCFTGVPLTSLYIPAVTNVGREAVGSDLLTNVTFGAHTVSFVDYHENGMQIGRSSFSKTANPCRFVFPGKAPALPKTGENEAGGYTGTTSMFGSGNSGKTKGTAILCGSWGRDPVGWRRILDEIGAPAAELDANRYPPPSVPEGWTVKGIFRYASDNYGWLVDCGTPAPGIVGLDDGKGGECIAVESLSVSGGRLTVVFRAASVNADGRRFTLRCKEDLSDEDTFPVEVELSDDGTGCATLGTLEGLVDSPRLFVFGLDELE